MLDKYFIVGSSSVHTLKAPFFSKLNKFKYVFPLPGVVQKQTSQTSPAGPADPNRGAEQGRDQAGEKERLPGQRGQLRERSQWAVHAALEYPNPGCEQQQQRGTCLHLEPGFHLAPLRPSLYLVFLLHAALVPHDLHPGNGLQPGLHGLLVLLHRHGLRFLPFAYAPPAIRGGFRHEPNGQQRGI